MSTQEIRDGVLHELNPVLVAEIDAFADMLEQRNLARDAAVCLEQELAAAEAENDALAACQAFALWVSDLARGSHLTLRRATTLDDIIRRANVALTSGGES